MVVHAANIQDRDGARLVLSKMVAQRFPRLNGFPGSTVSQAQRFPRLKVIWADGAYAGKLVAWAWVTGGWLLSAVRRRPDSHSFEVLPRRWVVERTLAWLGRCRPLSKDFEALPETSEAWVYVAMIHLMLKRLQPA